ncbi:MAG: hypothetical protein R3E96_15845 [Planctomycetota bacterium]
MQGGAEQDREVVVVVAEFDQIEDLAADLLGFDGSDSLRIWTTMTCSPGPKAERRALSWRAVLFWMRRLAQAMTCSVER